MTEPGAKLCLVTSLGAMRGVRAEDCLSVRDKALVLAPGEVRRLCDLEGPGRIVRLWFTTPRLGQRHVLRDVVWRIFWDDEAEPSVECPVGDLFGAAFGRPYRLVSDRLVVAGGGYVCRFEMPFRSRAVIEIHNQSSSRFPRMVREVLRGKPFRCHRRVDELTPNAGGPNAVVKLCAERTPTLRAGSSIPQQCGARRRSPPPQRARLAGQDARARTRAR